MTKQEILEAICELPGWQPPQPTPDDVADKLAGLLAEGLIIPRLDGWEATPKALDAYGPPVRAAEVREETLAPILVHGGQRVITHVGYGHIQGEVEICKSIGGLTEVEITIRYRDRPLDERGRDEGTGGAARSGDHR